MDKLRGIVRPFLMISGWTLLSYFALTMPDIRQLYAATVIGFTGWWFGERMSEKKK